jgi:hypothetical protein
MFTKNSREIHGHFKIIGENTYIKLYNKFKIPVGLVVWGNNYNIYLFSHYVYCYISLERMVSCKNENIRS